MKKAICYLIFFSIPQFLLLAQSNEIDSILLERLNQEIILINDAISIDFNFYYNDQENRVDLQKEMNKVNAILTFLQKNKFFTIEMGVHTDCRGNLIYNERISELRAKRLVSDILESADSKTYHDLNTRIIPKGYGEFFPLEDCECEKCTAIQHQNNNRVVLKLIRNNTPIKLTTPHVPNASSALRGREGRGPRFDPAAQVEGKITLKICVNQDGKVIQSETILVPKATTINNKKVIQQAIEYANRWKFNPAKEDFACGTITYVIKLK